MADRKMIPGLVHRFAWATDDTKFFEQIEALGGWPAGYRFVGFEHTDERSAGFTNSPQNSGWWTVIANADDYYLWKLSPEMLQRIVDAAVAAARITTPDATKLWIRRGDGSIARKPRPAQAQTKGDA